MYMDTEIWIRYKYTTKGMLNIKKQKKNSCSSIFLQICKVLLHYLLGKIQLTTDCAKTWIWPHLSDYEVKNIFVLYICFCLTLFDQKCYVLPADDIQ